MEKRNIAYFPEEHSDFHTVRHLLDVYHPENQTNCPVLIFIHGGTWMNGSKDVYQPLGRNLAHKGVVGVVINYRLGESADFEKMALDCAAATQWVFNNIENYNGDKNNISISGHSAGGHLASLVSLDSSYLNSLGSLNPIKNAILLDAFGLNIEWFIKEHGTFYLNQIEKVFSREPKLWRKASPVNFVNSRSIPFQIYLGEKTYPFLTLDNQMFFDQLKKVNNDVYYEVIKGKSHVEMVTQLENTSNPLYEKLISFITNNIKASS